MTLIELGPQAPVPDRPVRPPITAYRPAGLIAAILLILALGVAVPSTPMVLRLLQVIPLTTEGSSAFTSTRVVTVGDGGRRREVTAWQIDPPRRLWSTTTEVSPGDPSANYTRFRIVVAGSSVVLQLPDRSTVLDLNTGRTRFTVPAVIDIIAPGVGLVRKTVFRPDAEPELDASTAGPEFTSEDGTTYREVPQHTDLRGIDLASGRVLWHRSIRGSAMTRVAGDATLVLSSDRVRWLDPATGRIFAERVSDGAWWTRTGAGLVIVVNRDRATAYDLTTFAARWTAPAAPFDADDDPVYCANVICRNGNGGVEVVDPLTGVTLWRAARGTSLHGTGDHVIEFNVDRMAPLRLVGAATGAPLADLGSWQSLGLIGSREPVLFRIEPGAIRTAFAVFRAGRVQPLGYDQSVADLCTADSGYILCRNAEGLRLLAYRAG